MRPLLDVRPERHSRRTAGFLGSAVLRDCASHCVGPPDQWGRLGMALGVAVDSHLLDRPTAGRLGTRQAGVRLAWEVLGFQAQYTLGQCLPQPDRVVQARTGQRSGRAKRGRASATAMRVLALVPYPLGEVPGQRYRMEQWAPYLHEAGIDVHFVPFAGEALARVLYLSGRYITKAWRMAEAYMDRLGRGVCVSRSGPYRPRTT
jgi:hypothetical protein